MFLDLLSQEVRDFVVVGVNGLVGTWQVVEEPREGVVQLGKSQTSKGDEHGNVDQV